MRDAVRFDFTLDSFQVTSDSSHSQQIKFSLSSLTTLSCLSFFDRSRALLSVSGHGKPDYLLMDCCFEVY